MTGAIESLGILAHPVRRAQPDDPARDSGADAPQCRGSTSPLAGIRLIDDKITRMWLVKGLLAFLLIEGSILAAVEIMLLVQPR